MKGVKNKRFMVKICTDKKQKDRFNNLSFLFKLTNLTKPKLMKINVMQKYSFFWPCVMKLC